MSGNQWGPPPPGQYPQQPPPGQYPPPPPGQFVGYGGPPQPQFGWGAPPGGPMPPRKKGSGAKVLLAILGVVVLGGIGLAGVSNALKHNSDPYSSPSIPTSTDSPTYEPSEEPSPAAATSRPTAPRTTAKPTTRPTTTRPTAPRTTSTPKPKPGPTDADLVLHNKLYTAGGMRPVSCKESRSRPSSAAGARANYSTLLKCLNKAWPSIVAKAGGRFRSPRVLSFSGTIQTPCGSYSDTGPPFYCGSTETIYMNLSEDIGNYNRHPEAYQKVWARMWMLHQFAHEYGHHVQNMTGILAANSRIRYEAPTQAAELEGSRRLELQASCFGDIFIGSNRRTYPVTGEALFQWKWLILHWTDYNNDHGDGVNHQYWATRGFNSRNPKVCNTFTASAGKVR